MAFLKGNEGQLDQMEMRGTSLSGSGLGLEHFRKGAKFEVETIEGQMRVLQIPGFGEMFQT